MSKEDPLLEFGREVRRRREAAKLTLEELAEKAGLTPNYIGTIENGRRDPSLSTLLALARGLDVSVRELLSDNMRDLSPAALEIAEMFDSIAPDVREGIALIVRHNARKAQR